jgi:predicted small secreted protein
MKMNRLVAPAVLASSLTLGACAQNYAVEGAAVGAAAGAGVAAIAGEDIETYALAGAAIGGIAGYFKDKNDDCDGFYDRNGRYVDDDCRYDDRYRDYF